MTSEGNVQAAARRLWQAAERGEPCAPVRDLITPGDIDAAYRVQMINDQALRAKGARPSGRKIGLTSLAVQKQLGVDQPDFGLIYADREFADGGAVPFASLMQPKVEAEIALVLGADIDVAEPRLADVILATAYVLPAIEIVASRIANWDITLVDTIADNASFGAYVLGSPVRRLDGLDLKACTMQLSVNGSIVSRGAGVACLGSPLSAATWLAGKMVSSGAPLKAGEVIMTGALGPMASVVIGDQIAAEIDGLGTVSFRLV